MELRRVREAVGDAWNSMYALYEAAFPWEERREREAFVRALADDRFYCMFLYEEGEMPLGFLTWWDAGDFLYMEHFATLPQLRGRGYGRLVLEQIKAMGRRLLLEAELPTDEITMRRVNFYTRAGFLRNVHRHLQPPYHMEGELLEMCVMTYPRVFSAEEYRQAYAFLWQVITGEQLLD